jgi:CheY-like chemotaxis protein
MFQKTILLVEPDSQARSTLRGGLEGMGYAVVEAGNGGSALRLASRSEIALTVTELYLPTDAEPCLVRAIGQTPALKRMKVLAYTKHAAESDRQWALRAGADAFLAKPTQLGRLLQVAGGLASSRSSSRREARGTAR